MDVTALRDEMDELSRLADEHLRRCQEHREKYELLDDLATARRSALAAALRHLKRCNEGADP
jgi:hypothetical protein